MMNYDIQAIEELVDSAKELAGIIEWALAERDFSNIDSFTLQPLRAALSMFEKPKCFICGGINPAECPTCSAPKEF